MLQLYSLGEQERKGLTFYCLVCDMIRISKLTCFGQIGMIDFIQWIFLIGLSIQALIFMREVLIEYASNYTSMKQIEVDLLEFPAITICFKDKIDYNYGIDLNVSVYDTMLDLSDTDTDYNENLIYFDYDYELASFLVLEKISCWVDDQICFKITRPNDQVNQEIPTWFDFKVEFNETIPENELPDIEVFFTSVENAYGVIFKDWVDGIELKQEFKKV